MRTGYVIVAFVLGGITSLSFAPLSLWIVPFITLFFLYELLIRNAGINRFWITYFFGLGLLIVSQSWTGVYVGNAPFLALAFMQAFFFTPLALVGKKSNLANSLIFGCALVFSEFLMRTIPFTGFGWSRLSFTQVDSPVAAIYPIIGVAGVAFCIAFFTSLRSIKTLFAASLVIVIFNFVPAGLNNLGDTKVALVQGGVPQLGLDFNGTPLAVYRNHLQQSKISIKPDSVDLIVWPENAVDIDVFSNSTIQSEISELSQELRTPILIGGISRFSGELQNISVLFNPKVTEIYAKRYLTPFGEYIPLRSLFQNLSPYVSEVKDFSAGNERTVFSIKDRTFQAMICYEIINDAFRDEMSENFLVLQTNNATFGDTAQLDQQLNIARVRAAEIGREIAYVSTTGVTSVIGSDGGLRSVLPKFEAGTLTESINMHEGKTVAQKLQFYPEIVAILLLLLLLVKRVRS
jgi:apolipoprotein N-acyltransferase